jgi:hypothetical protein
MNRKSKKSISYSVLFLLLCICSFAFSAESPNAKEPASAEKKGVIPASYKEFTIKDIKIKFGGDDRLRYENWDDFYFGESKPGNNDNIWYNRLRINMNASYQFLSIFLEGLENDQWGSDRKPATQRDEMDLHQGYLKFSKPGNLPVNLTLGRQELSYGDQRLIAAAVWSNNIRSFDAIKFTYNPALFDIDFFAGNEVIYENHKFNPARWGKYLFGAYITYKGISDNVFDFYSINLTDDHDDNKSQTNSNTTYGDIKRYTIGSRGKGKVASTDFGYGLEIAYQFGNQDAVTSGVDKSQDIRAYAVHADVNYTFKNVSWKPFIKFEYNYASGDNDPNDGVSKTFDPLYQTTHAPYGIIDFFRWQNMEEFAFVLEMKSIKKDLKSSLEYHRFYLAQARDAWYNTSGTKIRFDSTGLASDYVAQEFDFVLSYKITSYLNLEGGYAHFFTGDYVKDTAVGPSSGAFSDVDWFYLQTVITF